MHALRTQLLRVVFLWALAFLLASCATTKLPPNVTLVDGVYYIPNEGIAVNGKSEFKLKPGRYLFATTKSGYRLKVHAIDIENRKAQFVQVEPGQGFAVAEFRFTPEPNAVWITPAAVPDAPSISLSAPWRMDLDEGRYRLEAQVAGHLPLTEEFEILPGQPVQFDLSFVAKPTSAPLRITTTPAGAELFLDGRSVGEAPRNLADVAFGARRIAAYIYRDVNNRLAFEGELDFGEHSPSSLNLELTVHQRRFEGSWYERAHADRLEERAYRSARTPNPLELQFSLPTLADKEDITQEQFTQTLFMLLRIGDRVRVNLDGTEYLIWKRSDRVDVHFRLQVAALWSGSPVPVDYEADPATVVEIRSPESRLITTVAYHLYRQVNDCPILDLGTAMHELDRISVHLLSEDGSVTVLTFGGSDVAINGNRIEATGQFGFQRLDPAAQTLEFTWAEKPRRILVVSSRSDLVSPRPSRALAVHEKRLFDLGVVGRVYAFHSFTKHPDGRWHHDMAVEDGAVGTVGNLDYNTVAVGPHEVTGDYTREWIVHYRTPNGNRATRQIPIDYRVSEDVEPLNPGEFIRRPD